MAGIRNISGEDLVVPPLGDRLVVAGQVVDVDPEDVYSYTQCVALWAPADDVAKATHQDAEAAYADAIEAAVPLAIAEIAPPRPPAGNASRDDWAAFMIGRGLQTEEQLAAKGRDEIRDGYYDGFADAGEKNGSN